jgi:hypothetical protein
MKKIRYINHFSSELQRYAEQNENNLKRLQSWRRKQHKYIVDIDPQYPYDDCNMIDCYARRRG